MARKPRLEFEGAIYHIINRGNYRKPVFGEAGAAAAFEKALFEASEKCEWIVHAYVVMANHFHLAVETPMANLVGGMAWLQGTFANRFNRFRGERGHVFQSRYKSILIEEGRPLLGLVNYIHLNPVRAGIVSLPQLRAYRSSSYPKLFEKKCPPFLCRSRFLGALEFPDTPQGMKIYAEYLETVEERDPSKHDELTQKYCFGWALASKEYRKEIKSLYAELPEREGWQGDEVKELREGKWQRELERQLKRMRKTVGDVEQSGKSVPWKITIARELKRTTTATNPWIANALAMGHPSRVCNLVKSFKL